MNTCTGCSTPFLRVKGEKKCPSCAASGRIKSCRTCGGTYTDASTNNTRRYCDKCADSATLPPGTPPEVRRKQRARESTRRWLLRNPDYAEQWAKDHPTKVRSYAWKWWHKRWAEDPVYREKKRKYERERRERIRLEAIAHYGGRCFCCGEARLPFLTLDHINDNGNEERRQTNNERTAILAKKRGWPNNLQVACYNCNTGRFRNGGICPHQFG